MWDTIVIGSGIAGMAAAAALARYGQRVLVLEQHSIAGGLTQTFGRGDWSFATGVHYIGGVGGQPGPDGQFGRLLHWLGDGTLEFASCGNPYDIVRLPGFEFGIPHPESAYRDALVARFPGHIAAIDQWFVEMAAARKSAYSLFAIRGMPAPLAWGLKLWRGSEVERLGERSVAQALQAIPDSRLRAVLGARWGDYGAPPNSAPLLEHALVTGAYNAGAYFPVGGPARFAQSLLAPVLDRGGMLELGATAQRIVVENGHADAVLYSQGGRPQRAEARHVISAMGVHNTAACLDAGLAAGWRQELRGLEPGLSYIGLYIGLEGNIAAAGASAANVWIYESEDIDRVWTRLADEDAPSFFVSFPSLKDPQTASKPTAEVMALCDAAPFARWMNLPSGERPEDYRAFKARIGERLLAQFERHFPALAPMVRMHVLATPVTQRHFVRTPGGSAYGLEMDAHRLGSEALKVRSPVSGLLIAGQDVGGAGIQSAAMSGLMAAAVIEPRLLRYLGS